MNLEIFALNIIQYIFIISLFIIIVSLLRQNISIKYERRIGRYAIDPLNKKTSSLLDNFKVDYNRLVVNLRKSLSRSVIIRRLSKRYEKYVIYGDNVKAIDFVIHKILISLLFLLLVIFSKALQNSMITLFEIIIYFILGYFIYDVYLIFVNKRRIKLIENQMLRAIIIMNNAFKSGKSTLQAVHIASLELEEPINHEFEKMYKDMKFGLSVDTVFERFSKRIDIEEAKYVSSSLTILNKTGGNIVKVFSSIEKTLFDKKKLKEELKNLTGSSNLVVKVLLFVPLVFVMIIYFLNPEYFNPLFSSPLGYLILFLIFLMFVLYACFLKRIMKVRV